MTGQGAGTSGSGLALSTTAAGNIYLERCVGLGGGTGIQIYNNNAGQLVRCRGTGGAAGGSGITVVTAGTTAELQLIDCVGTGGGGGTNAYGLYIQGSWPIAIYGGRYYGGPGGTGCVGFAADNYAQGRVYGAFFQGGGGGSACYGGSFASGARFDVDSSTFIGGIGGINGIGLYLLTNARARFRRCAFVGGGGDLPTTTTASFTAANNGQQRPSATVAYTLTDVIRVAVSVATPGATVQFGSTIGGTDLTAAQSLAATGTFYLPVTGNVLVAGGGYFYATTTGAPADATFTISYEVEWGYATSNAAYLDSGYSEFLGCEFQSNAASHAVYATANGIIGTRIFGSRLIAGWRTTGRMNALYAVVAWLAAAIHYCVLDGGQTNVACAAATAVNGTSIEV